MRRARSQPKRVLAIDPTSRGFGFVVLEGSSRLVDWGLKDARRGGQHAGLAKLRELIDLYRPEVLVAENCLDRRSRRGARAHEFIHDASALVTTVGVKTRLVSLAEVRKTFGECGPATKHAIADVIAARFPELAPHRPRFRKPWMSEDERQAIFDAAAFALTLLG